MIRFVVQKPSTEASKKDYVLFLLSERCQTPTERSAWVRFAELLSNEQLATLAEFLEGEFADAAKSYAEPLERYLERRARSRDGLQTMLHTLTAGSPALADAAAAALQTLEIPGTMLTDEHLDLIAQSDETFARYLASLSSDQLDYLYTRIAAMPAAGNLTDDVKSTLLQLLQNAREEAYLDEVEIAHLVRPLAESIALAARMQQQIVRLEQIASSLKS